MALTSIPWYFTAILLILPGLPVAPAMALHEGSTPVVMFEAPRLLAYRDPTEGEPLRL